ncbi:hypothetical protein I7X29_12845 [Capnocytophaga sp. p1a2]|uniref:hypothetical protein n=2 Tax=Capnocytophaga TaxID=1016 RepID=UPI0018E12B70|nr:hypothetical protein [uncultured Capnocytophaga sp.]MBI1669470.1 hypothetical protein [Capnocytophaga periodontitidis]
MLSDFIKCVFKIRGKGRGIGDEENESGRVWLNMVVYGKVFVILQGEILTIKDFMKITIFYSWQSTTDPKYNKIFIKTCIEKATKEIKKKNPFKSIDFELQEGINKKPGSPSIADTIMDERIPNADIFIADLSIVNYLPCWKRILKLENNRKSFLNNNVTLEYGIAYNALGKERIIGIINTSYGSSDKLPFDIQHRRYPIEYKYSKKDKNESDIKEELINNLKVAIRDIIQHILEEQKNKYRPFKTWEQWKDEINIQSEFIENKKTKEIRDIIMKEIDNPNKSPIRITGLSGIGKTRILFEIFRKIEGDEKTILLSNRVLYLNYDDFSNNHLEIINTINREKSDAILIIDNCNADGYEKFIRNLKGFKLSLISIDSNPEENYEDSQYIKIGNEDLLDSIEDIIKAKSDNLEQSTIEIIKQISQGVPLIAILLCENIVNGKLTKEPDNKGLLDKILGKKGEKWRYILDSCSLFRKVGYENEKKEQYNFIVTNENLTISNNNHIVRLKESEEAVKYYIKRGIFEKRGRYLSIRPFFLSVLLASKYLESISSEHFHNIIKDIQDKLEKPHKEELMNYLSEQIRYLGYNTDIRTIIDNFVGDKSYFDSIEVLNTELGSRLFRSFVEVNPVAISDNLYRQFNNKKTEELLEFKEGRRNIIWTLEKLCFGKETFANSTKILYRLAVAENESWANNATGQFLQLFHIYLAGTEVSLKERLKIIKWGLGMKDEKFTQLAIKAMASGLTTNHFARMKGAERQGIDEIKDYVPTYDEISEYYKSILDELINLIRSEGIYIDEVSKIIADSIRGLTNIGLIAIVLPYIDDVIAIKKGIWQEGLDSIRMTLAFEGNKILEEHRTHLQKIIEELSKDFMTRFRSYDKFYDKNYSLEKFEEKEKERMYSLAEVFMEFKEVEQRELLSKLYKRERGIYVIYQSYFGKSISDFFNDNIDKSEKFINISLSIAEELGEELFDYSILLGFIEQSEREIKKYFYQKVGEKSYLNYLLFIFVANDEKGVEYFDQLFKLIDNHPQLFSYLGHLKYRMALQKLSIQEIESLQNKLLNYEIQGYIMIFELLSSIRTQDTEKQIVIDGFLKECIYKIGVQWNNNIDNFQYFNHIRSILKNEEKDEKLCSFVINDIINYINWDTAFSLEPYRSIFEIALSDYFDSTWAIISSAIINENDGYMKFWGIKQLLGGYVSNIYTKKDILFNNDNVEKIIDWCNKNQPIAPTLIAELVPIYNEDRTEWNPIAKRLIDEFGNIKEVLDRLGANMNSFSWSGSIVPLLESNKKLLESIVDNSNPMVSEWARQNINELSKRIIQEKKKDEEYFIT